MAAGTNIGLTGLTHRIDKRARDQENLTMLSQLYEMKQNEELKEQEAALIEQQYYKAIRDEADKMLAGDRKRINEKSKAIQAQIKQQIKAFGGSRSKFMANGGMAMLGDYSNDLLGSEEVATYKQNKVNLEKLLDAKAKGMGHLIPMADQNSLDAYGRNGVGTITYSGLKNEVELPDPNSLVFGTYASPGEILLQGQNYSKILANYKIDNPDDPIEFDDPKTQYDKLHQYTALNYISQRGTRMLPNYSSGSGGKRTGTGDQADNPLMKATQSGELRFGFGTKMNPLVNVLDIKHSPFYADNYAADVFGKSKYKRHAMIEPTILEKIGYEFYGQTLEAMRRSLDPNFEWDQNNNYVPSYATSMNSGLVNPMFETQNVTGEKNEKGNFVMNLKDMNNVVLADGTPVTRAMAEKIGQAEIKLTGAFAGYEFLSDGNSYLMVDATDEEGNYKEDQDKSMYDREDGKPIKGRKAVYVAFEADGQTFYQKMDIDNDAFESQLADKLGEANELTDQREEMYGNRAGYDKRARQVEVAQRGQANLEVSNETFDNNTDFQTQVRHYNVGSRTTKRADLMKAFYMAYYDMATEVPENGKAQDFDLDFSIRQNDFATFMGGLGLESELTNVNRIDSDLIKMMRRSIMSKEQNEEDSDGTMLTNNDVLMTKIENYFRKVRALRYTTNKPKAQFGVEFGFTPGSTWKVSKEFEGPSHSQGGIDVNTKDL